MKHNEDYPRLRAGIEAYPVENAGRKAILLRDRLQIAQDVALPMHFACLLTMLNGNNSLRDIQAVLVREGGSQLVPIEDIERLVEILNVHHYLDNDNFHQYFRTIAVREGDLSDLREEDLSMLKYVVDCDPEGFFRFIMAEKDRRKICGLPPVYALLHLVEGQEVRILHYDQAYNAQATVTFASIALLG